MSRVKQARSFKYFKSKQIKIMISKPFTTYLKQD